MIKYRPQFHFTPTLNWMNDPNGLIYYEGEYHLFYQHNPFESKWGHMSWGHAVSPNLVDWNHLPVALAEENDEMIFSGCTLVDLNNSSGFGTDSLPPIVAVYTGRRNSDDRQYQCLAYSNDNGRSFTKYSGNPVIDIGSDNFRDPKVFWFERGEVWIMVVAMAVEQKVCFYKSKNLIDWNKSGEFQLDIKTDEKWECPDLFSLQVDDDPVNEKWVLVISTLPDSHVIDSECRYFIGNFDGNRFIADNFAFAEKEKSIGCKIDYGKDFYALTSYSGIPDSDGRKICIAWMNNWAYASELPTGEWKGSLSIPRMLKLKTIRNNIRLVQEPVAELTMLRSDLLELNDKSFNEINRVFKSTNFTGAGLEIFAEIQFEPDSEFGLKIKSGVSDEIAIYYKSSANIISLDRRNSGDVSFNPSFASIQKAELESKDHIRLHIFIDSSSIEVFVNEGEVVFTDLFFPFSEHKVLEFVHTLGTASVKKMMLWKLNR